MKVGVELLHQGKVMLWRPLERGALVIGRNPECDLSVPAETIAPVQCVIRRDERGLLLENHAKIGTRVGEEQVTEKLRLADGDEVVLGPMTARVVFGTSSESTSTAATRTRTLSQNDARPASAIRLAAPETHPGELWSLDRDINVGSDPTCDIVLDDPYVSTFHACFSQEQGRCMVRDLGSRNGVFVGDRKIREAEIPPGSQVTLGRSVIMVQSLGSERTATTRQPQGAAARLIGSSPATERVRELVRRVAATDAPVLITGETGTGKEVVARLTAELSPRATAAFVAINCGALSRNLVESELFGHERGAFTGALQRKLGAFEAADGGTLFLDEIGELPLELQPQLLRALETGEVRRVGETSARRVDVRILAATNRRLEQEVAAGSFREDLYHRLHVLTVELPPLRERPQDIEDLTRHFLSTFAPRGERLSFTADAMQRLKSHSWSGNVRELRNVIQRAVLLRSSDSIDASDITFTPSTLESRVETASATSGKTLQEIERDAILTELRRCNGNKKEVAAALGVSRSTIHRKLDEFGVRE